MDCATAITTTPVAQPGGSTIAPNGGGEIFWDFISDT